MRRYHERMREDLILSRLHSNMALGFNLLHASRVDEARMTRANGRRRTRGRAAAFACSTRDFDCHKFPTNIKYTPTILGCFNLIYVQVLEADMSPLVRVELLSDRFMCAENEALGGWAKLSRFTELSELPLKGLSAVHTAKLVSTRVG
jgi:hypothetical protein